MIVVLCVRSTKIIVIISIIIINMNHNNNNNNNNIGIVNIAAEFALLDLANVESGLRVQDFLLCLRKHWCVLTKVFIFYMSVCWII